MEELGVGFVWRSPYLAGEMELRIYHISIIYCNFVMQNWMIIGDKSITYPMV